MVEWKNVEKGAVFMHRWNKGVETFSQRNRVVYQVKMGKRSSLRNICYNDLAFDPTLGIPVVPEVN